MATHLHNLIIIAIPFCASLLVLVASCPNRSKRFSVESEINTYAAVEGAEAEHNLTLDIRVEHLPWKQLWRRHVCGR